MSNDFVETMQRQIAQLETDDTKAKVLGTLVGRYVTYPVADGYAYYKITRATKTTAALQWQDIGDGYAVSAWGRPSQDGTVSVKLSVVLPLLRHRDGLKSFVAKTDDWWANQRLGAVVHYSNGFGEYVRGVIVEANGEKAMRPTALVGNWKSSWDLVTRRADGSISYGHYPKMINSGETFHPNATNMVEYPGFRLNSAPHPSTLKEVDLSVPGLSLEQQELARVETLRKQAVALLEDVTITNDIAASYASVIKALRAAKRLLEG